MEKLLSNFFVFLISVLLLESTVYAKNQWQTHGYSFSYFSDTGEVILFPIAWDLRSANNLINTWQEVYSKSSSHIIQNILKESYESGFNSTIVRSELADRWFPETPGFPGDDFFPLAARVREIGLNLFVGGLKTDLNEWQHNNNVINYLQQYIQMTSGVYDGDIIGCFAFDEPDVKYMEDPNQAQEWLDFVSFWTHKIEAELQLKSMCYFAKYADVNSSGQIEYYSDTTSVLNRMSRYIDMVSLDMYPVKNNFRRSDELEYTHGIPTFVAITDIIQDCQFQAQSLNNKDEVISIFSSGDSALVLVESIEWNGIDLSFNTSWTGTLPFMPDAIASSDFRAGYYSGGGNSKVNSALVFVDNSLSMDEIPIMLNRSGVPEFCQFFPFHGSCDMTPVFFSVGQTDYWRDILEVEGVIGRGRLAILACMQDGAGDYFLMLYVASGDEEVRLYPIFDEPSKLFFNPVNAIWGTFWGTWYVEGTAQRVVQNGFIVYDEVGDYVALTQLNRDDWWIYPASGTIEYHDLFGSSQIPDFIRVSHVDGTAPSFFDGYDRLVGYFSESNSIVTARSSYAGGKLNLVDTVLVSDLPSSVTSFDFLRNDHRYQDRSVFTLINSDVYLGESGFENSLQSGVITANKINYCYGDTIIGGFRTMHTRDAIRSVLIAGDNGYSVPQCEIYDDVFDDYRFDWFPEVFQVGFNNGVLSTDRDNTLFAVIQAYGQHAFALPSYCASADTMLYMAVAPIVAGARGLVFYALDISMMSGNGGDDGVSRAPFILQNWGPSRDIKNTDMIGVVHQAVAKLTGNNGGTNYTEKLIDLNWIAMDESEIFNTQLSDTLFNFIALRKQIENAYIDTLIVIAVNESHFFLPLNDGIFIKNLPKTAEIISYEGFAPNLIAATDSTDAFLDYSGMGPVSASLITISTVQEEFNGNGWMLSSYTQSNGASLVSYSVPLESDAKLKLYDIMGREVELLWSGSGSGIVSQSLIEKNNHPAGLYFLSLSGNGFLFTEKCFLW